MGTRRLDMGNKKTPARLPAFSLGWLGLACRIKNLVISPVCVECLAVDLVDYYIRAGVVVIVIDDKKHNLIRSGAAFGLFDGGCQGTMVRAGAA
jgi:hypothetical protein